MPLYLKQREIGPMENFQYLLGDTETKRCWMVDPAWEAESLYDEAVSDGYEIEGYLITHAHFDHTNALERMLKRKEGPVYLQKRELEFLDKGAARELFPDIPRTTLKPVSPGDRLSLGGVKLTFVHTPGHTPGSQCFMVEGNLVSGDTLFLTTCGRVDLPGANPYEMFESLTGPLSRLPAGTLILPGHNYSTHGATALLGDVKKNNRFFRARDVDEFLGLAGL